MNNFTKEELIMIEDYLDTFLDTILNDDYENKSRDLLDKVSSMLTNYPETECSHKNLVRLKLLSEKDYDFCENCLFVRRIR